MSHLRAIASNLKADGFEITDLLTFLDLAELQKVIQAKLHTHDSSITYSISRLFDWSAQATSQRKRQSMEPSNSHLDEVRLPQFQDFIASSEWPNVVDATLGVHWLEMCASTF
jgi:hypothetical protein